MFNTGHTSRAQGAKGFTAARGTRGSKRAQALCETAYDSPHARVAKKQQVGGPSITILHDPKASRAAAVFYTRTQPGPRKGKGANNTDRAVSDEPSLTRPRFRKGRGMASRVGRKKG